MKKGIVVATSLILLTGLISGCFLYHSTAEAKEQAQQYIKAKKAVDGLYNTDKTKPNSELNTAQIDRAEELIKMVKDKSKREKLLKLKNAAVTMDAARRYVEAVIKNNVLKDDATEIKIVKAEDQVAKVENISPSYYQELTKLLGEARKQLKQIDIATTAVNNEFKNGKVINGISRDSYNKAKTEVDKIKNTTIKNKLSEKLAQVLKVVKANEEKAKKEAEAKAHAEAQAKQQKAGANSTVQRRDDDSVVDSTSVSKSTVRKTTMSSSKETTGSESKTRGNKTTAHKSDGVSNDDMRPGTTYEGTVTESGSIPGTGNTYLGGTW